MNMDDFELEEYGENFVDDMMVDYVWRKSALLFCRQVHIKSNRHNGNIAQN